MDDLYNHGAHPDGQLLRGVDPYAGSFPPPPPAALQPPTPPAGRSRPGLRAPPLAGGLVAAVVAGGVGFAAGRRRLGRARPGPDPSVVQAGPGGAERAGPRPADAPRRRSRRRSCRSSSARPAATRWSRSRAGSGVVISADGLVLTNAHVIDGADVIQVQLTTSGTIRADLVGTSPSHDIALVRLRDTTDLTPATLGVLRRPAGRRRGRGHRQRPQPRRHPTVTTGHRVGQGPRRSRTARRRSRT